MILAGCGTTRPIINDDLVRQQPVEALQPCEELSRLPEDLPELDVSKAVTLILSAHMNDIAAFKDCKRKHEALREWIKAE